MFKASLQYTPNELTIGRVTLPRQGHASERLIKTAGAFADTQYACNLMEQIATCVYFKEPVLLVGETGNGKTTVVQRLAQLAGKRLIVQNLNQQSDSSDFLGGYKPVELRSICVPLMNQFGALFPKTFSRAANKSFLTRIRQAFEDKKWPTLIKLLLETLNMVEKKFNSETISTPSTTTNRASTIATTGKRKSPDPEEAPIPSQGQTKGKNSRVSGSSGVVKAGGLQAQWAELAKGIRSFERQITHVSGAFAFWFAEGSLVSALREGHWILLDEINLASSETLERLSGILDGEKGSLSLTERGDSGSIYRHPDFRIFACMNPPTDVGKKDLPPCIRNNFAELFVQDVTNPQDIGLIVQQYVSLLPFFIFLFYFFLFNNDIIHMYINRYLQEQRVHLPIDSIVSLYLQLRSLATSTLLTGEDKRPLYSLRSLCRALSYCRKNTAVYSFERALYDGFCMSFSSSLNSASRQIVDQLFLEHILNKKKSLIKVLPKLSGNTEQWMQIHQFWVKRGEHKSPNVKSKYILTSTVQNRLKDLARVVNSGLCLYIFHSIH